MAHLVLLQPREPLPFYGPNSTLFVLSVYCIVLMCLTLLSLLWLFDSLVLACHLMRVQTAFMFPFAILFRPHATLMLVLASGSFLVIYALYCLFHRCLLPLLLVFLLLFLLALLLQPMLLFLSFPKIFLICDPQ
jgi:hypothetical protein